jgi:hypothetical protein
VIINEEQDDSKEGKTQTNEKKYFQNQRWDSQSYLRTTNDQYFVNGYLTTSVIKTLRLPYGVKLKIIIRSLVNIIQVLGFTKLLVTIF